MTEDSAVTCLSSGRWSRGFTMPRYTPGGWWECDLFHLTPAGYFWEFEIKLTVADFRRDAGKKMRKGPYRFGVPEVFETKHDLLVAADPRGPACFYYVTPEGLLDKEPLPPWAGWIELREVSDKYGTRLYEQSPRVKAPNIHRVKMTTDGEHAMNTAYYRMHRFGRGLERPVDEYLVTI